MQTTEAALLERGQAMWAVYDGQEHLVRFWAYAVPGSNARLVVEDEAGYLHWVDARDVVHV